MIRPVLRLFAVLSPLAALVAGCGSPATPTTTTTTTTTSTTSTASTVTTTETYSGSLGSGATNFHVFHTLPGPFVVTLQSIDPSTIYPPLGMGFGMWDGSSCVVVLSTQSAVPTTVLTGTASIETDVCVKMWDPTPWDPSFTLAYTVTALHYAKTS